MPWVIDKNGVRVEFFSSDAEAVRWWRNDGEAGDRLEDTGELLDEVDESIGLED